MDPISALGLSGMGPGADAVHRASGIKDASEGFEAIFLRQILRDLRKTAAFDGESSAMTGFYTDMFDDFLAEHLAKAGGIGLAGAIQTYLKRPGQ